MALQSGEVSIYSGELTDRCYVECVATIKDAFPALPLGFYKVLFVRLKENNYCDTRLRDAIAHVIDNCIYPTPTIANFISFDRFFKVYTHEEMVQLTHEGKATLGGDFKAVRLPGRKRVVWAHTSDIEQYKLKKVNNDTNDEAKQGDS